MQSCCFANYIYCCCFLPFSLSAYHLYGNFGEKFPLNGTGIIFWHRKQEQDWVVPFTKYRQTFHFLSTWSLALVIQTNGTENFARFGKNGKKVMSRNVLLFFQQISTGMNRSIWILPEISGFSVQMVSVGCFHLVFSITRFFVFFEETININGVRFSLWLNLFSIY